GIVICFFFSSRRRHTRFSRDWSSDVCSSDLHESDLFGARLVTTESRGALVDETEVTVTGRLRDRCLGRVDAWTVEQPPIDHRFRSEERRVGKEGRGRWLAWTTKKKAEKRYGR